MNQTEDHFPGFPKFASFEDEKATSDFPTLTPLFNESGYFTGGINQDLLVRDLLKALRANRPLPNFNYHT